jgi:trans-AT polyketide synthase, acyltransferase and oxidoreductase domains
MSALSFNGYLKPSHNPPETEIQAIHQAIFNITQPVFIVDADGATGVCQDGNVIFSDCDNKDFNDSVHYTLLSYTPPLSPENLGHPEFKNRYNIKYPYIAGAMAHGISSVELVKAAGNADFRCQILKKRLFV